MPFIRHLRDRRGFETTLVMHGYRAANGVPKSRVLYLFRSPSHLAIGRDALDEEAREALTHTHPDLTFDWIALGRERDQMRAHQQRERATPDRRPGPAERPRPPARVVVEDHSNLGRALGAERAKAIRTQYSELVQRITRRARTPEDRDRLSERAQRLNPDEWKEDAIASLAAGFEAERQAILGELPARRRGRRGGRRGERPEGATQDAAEGSAPEESGEADEVDDGGGDERTAETVDPGPANLVAVSSVLSQGQGEGDASNAREERTDVAAADGDHGGGRIDRRLGTGSPDAAAGDGLPGDGEFRPD
jgi:hypothetical protein